MTNWNLVKPVLQNTFSFSQKLKDLVTSQSKRMREGWGEKICEYKFILLEGSVQSMHFGSRHIPIFLRDRKYPQVQGKLKLSSLIFRFPRLPTSLWLISQLCSSDLFHFGEYDEILSGILFPSLEYFVVSFLLSLLHGFASVGLFLLLHCFSFLGYSVESFHCLVCQFFFLPLKLNHFKNVHTSLYFEINLFFHEIVNNGIIEVYAWATDS